MTRRSSEFGKKMRDCKKIGVLHFTLSRLIFDGRKDRKVNHDNLFIKGCFFVVNDNSIVKFTGEGLLVIDDLFGFFNKV